MLSKLRAAVSTPFFVSRHTKEQSKVRRRNWQTSASYEVWLERLLTTKFDLNDVVFAKCAAGNTTNTIRCPMQRRHKTYASVRRASLPDGVGTMSASSVASAKPR